MMVSIGLKMLGCALVLAGSSGYGVWLANRYRRQLAEAEQLRQMIFLLKGQIIYANAPLHEALEAVGKRSEGEFAALFVRAAERIARQDGEMFSAIWKQEVEQLGRESGSDFALSKEDRQALAALGEHLGFLDREMQERNLLLYLEQLDLRIQQLREHKQERCRLYTSLGVMSGLFLAILLV